MAVSLKETILPAMLLRYQLIDIYNRKITPILQRFETDIKLNISKGNVAHVATKQSADCWHGCA